MRSTAMRAVSRNSQFRSIFCRRTTRRREPMIAHRNNVARRSLASCWMLAALTAMSSLAGCKGGGSTDTDAHADGLGDGTTDLPLPMCPEPAAASEMAAADDFGPNAKAVAMPSAMGRVNVYEVTSAHLLERIDIYVRGNLAGSRVTIAV